MNLEEEVSWDENAITLLKVDLRSEGAAEVWVLLHVWNEEVHWRDVDLLLLILFLFVVHRILHLTGVDFLSVDVWNHDNGEVSFDSTHDLLLLFVVWLINEVRTHEEFYIVEISDIVIEVWKFDVFSELIGDGFCAFLNCVLMIFSILLIFTEGCKCLWL